MSVYRREVRLFDESQIALLSTFVDQAVIAIDNVRLFQALEARTDELGEALERQTATSDILRTISQSPTDYGPVFDAILDSATRLCDAPLAFLLMREGDYFHLVAHKGSRPEFVEWTLANPVPFSEGKTLAARAAIEGVPRQLADITDTEAYREGLPHRVMSADVEGIRTTLFVPMMKGDDCVGVIAIYRREVRSFNESHIALVSTFADQAVIAIDNVHLFQALDDRTRELARSVEELRALGEIGQAVNSTLDPETVLSTIINQAVALTGTDGGLISEYDEATGTLPARAAPGFEEILEGTDPVRIGEGAMGQAAETRTPVQIPDIDATDAYTGRLRAQLDRAGLKALLAVPLLREDRVLGTLLVARKTPGEFPPGTVELLGTFAAQSALAIHNARLFREIEEKGRELAQANQHKSEFLANMSHELRTPLNAVIGFSEVLGEEMFGELNEKQSEYVDDIHTSGRHLLSLINDILDLSKIEAGRMELDVTTFDIREALGNALTLVGERAARGGIVLESEIEESLADMTGDERKVKQILLNLLSNAVKFTPEGGRVTLTAKAADVALVIAVRDTGVGISAEDQEHIFEEFRQVGTDYARKVEGTGLGLTLTRRFVELHGGEIAVESEPGAGSEFLITLPLEPPAAAAE
jgi:signal transduction histidine kinase